MPHHLDIILILFQNYGVQYSWKKSFEVTPYIIFAHSTDLWKEFSKAPALQVSTHFADNALERYLVKVPCITVSEPLPWFKLKLLGQDGGPSPNAFVEMFDLNSVSV